MFRLFTHLHIWFTTHILCVVRAVKKIERRNVHDRRCILYCRQKTQEVPFCRSENMSLDPFGFGRALGVKRNTHIPSQQFPELLASLTVDCNFFHHSIVTTYTDKRHEFIHLFSLTATNVARLPAWIASRLSFSQGIWCRMATLMLNESKVYVEIIADDVFLYFVLQHFV